MKYLQSGIEKVSLALLAFLITLSPVATFADGDPIGNWSIVVDMGGTPVKASLVVAKNDDGSLGGKLQNAMFGEAEVTDVKFDGENLSFKQTFGEGDTAMEFTFAGTLSGNSFEGMLNSEAMGEMKVTGTRDVAVTFYGTWEITSNSQLGELVRELVVNSDGSGTYNEFDISDFALDGNAVSFNVTIDVQGQDMPLELQGTYSGKEFTGNFLADGNSVSELTGKQTKGAAPDLSAIAGTYAAEVDAQGDIIEGTITVTASSADFEGTEFTDITFDGTKLTFHIDYDADGQVLPLDFEGTVSDTEITGDYNMDGSPVASMVAKKQ